MSEDLSRTTSAQKGTDWVLSTWSGVSLCNDVSYFKKYTVFKTHIEHAPHPDDNEGTGQRLEVHAIGDVELKLDLDWHNLEANEQSFSDAPTRFGEADADASGGEETSSEEGGVSLGMTEQQDSSQVSPDPTIHTILLTNVLFVPDLNFNQVGRGFIEKFPNIDWETGIISDGQGHVGGLLDMGIQVPVLRVFDPIPGVSGFNEDSWFGWRLSWPLAEHNRWWLYLSGGGKRGSRYNQRGDSIERQNSGAFQATYRSADDDATHSLIKNPTLYSEEGRKVVIANFGGEDEFFAQFGLRMDQEVDRLTAKVLIENFLEDETSSQTTSANTKEKKKAVESDSPPSDPTETGKENIKPSKAWKRTPDPANEMKHNELLPAEKLAFVKRVFGSVRNMFEYYELERSTEDIENAKDIVESLLEADAKGEALPVVDKSAAGSNWKKHFTQEELDKVRSLFGSMEIFLKQHNFNLSNPVHCSTTKLMLAHTVANDKVFTDKEVKEHDEWLQSPEMYIKGGYLKPEVAISEEDRRLMPGLDSLTINVTAAEEFDKVFTPEELKYVHENFGSAKAMFKAQALQLNSDGVKQAKGVIRALMDDRCKA